MKRKIKSIDLCGIPYKVVYFPGPGKKERECENSVVGFIDNDKREIHVEKGRTDSEYVLFHEIVHGAIEAIKIDNSSASFDKHYGEGFVRPFSRFLFSMLKSAGLIKKI